MRAKALSSSRMRPSLRRRNSSAADISWSLAAAHREDLAGDPAGIVGGEEQHAVSDILGLAGAAQRDALDQSLLALGAIGIPLLLGRRIGAHEAGCDVVDGDAERPELV